MAVMNNYFTCMGYKRSITPCGYTKICGFRRFNFPFPRN